jgi:hypothetical protein
MGHARESSAIRAKARYREDGKWTYLRIKVNSDIRDKSDKSRKGSPDNDNYNVSTIYDPEINEELALADAEKRLDKEDSEYTHFNLEYLGEAEE